LDHPADAATRKRSGARSSNGMAEGPVIFWTAVVVVALFYARVYKDRYRRSRATRDLIHLILHWMAVAIGSWGV
jgi:hypothetical protein